MRAMNHLLLALNLHLSDGAAPEWTIVIPAGSTAQGHDGREWINDNPQRIVDAFVAGGRDLPIDINHANEIKAVAGEPAPAQGWMKELQVRDGAVWARVEWNKEGQEAIQAKHYRYLSPAIYFDKERRIQGLKSAGLVNSPNLVGMPALNYQTPTHNEEEDMKLSEAIRNALGLNAEATDADAVAAIGSLKSQHQVALNAAQNPPMDKFVPRADYDKQHELATNAQQELDTLKTNGKKAEVESAVDGAIKAGKIAPSSRDYYIANCMQEGGLEQFKQFAEKTPSVFKDTHLDDKKPNGDKLELNAEQDKVNAMMGITAEDIKQFGS